MEALRRLGGSPIRMLQGLATALTPRPPPASPLVSAQHEVFRADLGPGVRARRMTQLEAALRAPDLRVVRRQTLGGPDNLNQTEFVVLSNGLTGVWKSRDSESRFTYRSSIPRGQQTVREAAAYRIDRWMDHAAGVPPTVLRELEGRCGALSLFVPDSTVLELLGEPNEEHPSYRSIATFDNVVGNLDRHEGNVMVTGDGNVVPIDHGLTFPTRNRGHRRLNFIYRDKIRLTTQEMADLRRLSSSETQVRAELQADGLGTPEVDALFDRVQTLLALGTTDSRWRRLR